VSAVGHAVWIDSTPLPVEITNHADWWQPYIPPLVGLLASLIVAAVAYRGVVLSNETNKAAITASDERSKQERIDARRREFLEWHRETLLHIGTETLAASVDCYDEWNRLANSPVELLSDETMEPIHNAGRRIEANSQRLRLLGAYALGKLVSDLRKAINDERVLPAAYALNKARREDAATQIIAGKPHPFVASDTAKAAEAEFGECLKRIGVLMGRFGQAMEMQLRLFNPSPFPPMPRQAIVFPPPRPAP
jgi:hypothetical protein